MNVFKIFCFFAFLTSFVFSAEETPDTPPDALQPTIDQQNILIHGCVNVITGHYIENARDLEIPGPREMALSRSYSSGNEQCSSLHIGWSLDQLSWCHFYRSGEKKIFHSFKPENQILCFSQGGGVLKSKREKIKEGQSFYTLSPHEDSSLGWCLANLYSGGKSLPKNMSYEVSDFDADSTKSIHIKEGSGKESQFHSTKTFSYQKKGVTIANEHLIMPISRVTHPNGHVDKFECCGKKLPLIDKKVPIFSKIHFYGAAGEQYGGFSFVPSFFSTGFTAEASNGRQVSYRFSPQGGSDKYLYLECVSAYAPSAKKPYYSCNYTVDDVKGCRRKKIISKNEPLGRFLNINYYSEKQDKKNKGKVRSLYGPYGRLYRFIYEAELTKHKRFLEGRTTVFDALGKKPFTDTEKTAY